ncbi:TPA: hypothetical protein AB5C23_001256 [Vibrio cholerae]|uniref:hypothetical protein n=1 Tax=Vibrio paracholerae TaxID=650003 RepID=UPI0020820AE6|nr:hypothetical protein [Vibrio paracholerae]MCO7020941.1 hypothetical protein [Vibrio paracholerae]GHX29976.1 hypothetical protein VCSRO62_0334 [Vibrio cholerae]
MNDLERNLKASAVMEFVDMIRGAYGSGFIDNHPTNYDIYRSAQTHVKDRYGVDTDNWDDELAKESRDDSFENAVQQIKQELLNSCSVLMRPHIEGVFAVIESRIKNNEPILSEQ